MPGAIPAKDDTSSMGMPVGEGYGLIRGRQMPPILKACQRARRRRLSPSAYD